MDILTTLTNGLGTLLNWIVSGLAFLLSYLRTTIESMAPPFWSDLILLGIGFGIGYGLGKWKRFFGIRLVLVIGLLIYLILKYV